MDDGRPIERRTGWDRRGFGERRRNADRRRGPDRRGHSSAQPAASNEARPYGFRSFADRREQTERRREGDAGADRRKTGERRDGLISQDETDVELTPEEVLALLHHPRNEKE